MNTKPTSSEYPPYYDPYIGKVPPGEIEHTLEQALNDTVHFLQSIPEEKGSYRYEPGKWSVKDVIQHIIDTEHVFSYRLLTIARSDQSNLPGFEQDDWAVEAKADYKTFSDLISEYQACRVNTLAIINSLSLNDWSKMGTANGNSISVNAIAWINAGHEIHHLGILRERYL